MFRKRVIQVLTFLGGLYFFLEWALPQSVLEKINIADSHEKISDGFILISVMALGLGIINLLLVHGGKLIQRRKGYFFSIPLLFGLFTMLTISFIDWRTSMEIQKKSQPLQMLSSFAKRIESDSKLPETDQLKLFPVDQRISLLLETTTTELEKLKLDAQQTIKDFDQKQAPVEYQIAVNAETLELELILQAQKILPEIKDLSQLTMLADLLQSVSAQHNLLMQTAYSQSTIQGLWKVLYDGLFVALGSAMFSLLGVYIASAAFRAFRIKSLESALMMLAAVLVMLGQIPFGAWIWPYFPEVRDWLLTYPNSAAFRAIKIGAAVASLVLAYRMWFSIESNFNERES